MIVTITLNGVTVTKKIPTSWAEVKFKDLEQITKNPQDTTAILSILTEIDVETLKRAKIANVDDIILALAFFQKDAPLVVPDKILGYPIPKDLGFETTMQYEDLKLHLKELKDKKVTDQEMLSYYPLYCAIYACTQKNQAWLDDFNKRHEFVGDKAITLGTYHWLIAQEMAAEFNEAPATEVLAIGNFTLLKLIGLNLGIKNGVPIRLTRKMKLMLVLKSWVKSLVLPVQLHIWKRRLRTKKVNS